VKKFILVVSLFFLSSCSSYLNVGSSEFDCPHVRPDPIKCVPPSVIEQLDQQGKFDWRWHPLPPEVCEKCEGCCRINELIKQSETERKSIIYKGVAVPLAVEDKIELRGEKE